LSSGAVAVIDTDILIDHLRGHRRFQTRGRPVAYSVVTRAELFAGTDEPDRVGDLLDALEEIPVYRAIAELSGTIRKQRGIDVADALIAATAVTLDLPLMTRNRRHFEGIKNLRLRAVEP
jgi:predicted nucleic acid-binding protein